MKEAFNRESISSNAAADMSFTPAGDIAATTIQAAIEEVDAEKVKRITSVDNEIARFDGTGGDVQGYSSNAPVISDAGIVTALGGVENTPIGQVTPAVINGTTGDFSDAVEIANDKWHKGTNFAGSDVVNMFKVNVDDEIDVGGTLVLGAALEAAEDSGAITLVDMSVSATPTAGDEMSFTQKVDGANVLTIGANADSAGGVTGEFVKLHGAQMVHKTDAGAADYNPSALTSDYIITVDTALAARAVIISTEDRDSGSADKPRVFIIKDIIGNAGANNITISLETAGTIDGAGTYVINANYDSITIFVDGTNGYLV